MIVKPWEMKDIPQGDRTAQAGAQAEKQLAFYLKRHFEDAKDVFVFNDLRLEAEDGDAAQMDHLLFHRHGFIIVESKSVTGQIHINRRGEWRRQYGSKKTGMWSPVAQATLQADFLKKRLNENWKSLRRKVPFLERWWTFDCCPFEILVAISDQGIIEGNVPELFKADQIPEQVWKIIKRHKSAKFRASLDDGRDKFPDDEMQSIVNFLLKQHKPLEATAKRPPVKPMSDAVPDEVLQRTKPESEPATCPECSSVKVNVAYGRYGYYFKCTACEKNFKIESTCPLCNQRARVRKSSQEYFMDCSACASKVLFHVNTE